ncbi:ceramide transfer protein isoform X2 [Eurosta solidaginis]|uniref:ceramide transfer protein isoform X2 n=1 Tax=Eurosta solidaginis TaxID=178769 RepID=UPI00353078A2
MAETSSDSGFCLLPVNDINTNNVQMVFTTPPITLDTKQLQNIGTFPIDSSSQSDNSENEFLDNNIELRGYLSKWTNYIYGWQPRYIVLKNGTISYYKSESESDFGCRGAISLSKALVKAHDSDELRFDIVVNNYNNWCLRAETPEDRSHWVEVLQMYKEDSASTDTTSLRRHDSTVSLQSNTMSGASGSSIRKMQKNLKEKVCEIETFKDILFAQIETLQRFFDACVDVNKETGKPFDNCNGLRPIDFKEGPHSTLPEDEFFDAVETGLERIEEDMQIRAKLKLQTQQSLTLANVPLQNLTKGKDTTPEEFGTGGPARNHVLWPEIDKVCKEQLHYAREEVGQGGNGWQIFADEGEIKMYKREEEVNGLVMDPLKAYHSVNGVTGREMCHYFFMPEYRNDWETTLEDCTILEKISEDTFVFLQTHKRIWPASQRDALFWSHMRKITDGYDDDAVDTWFVCNNSTDYSNQESKNGKCIRILLTVILVCQTYLPPGKTRNDPISRDELTCKITYCSVVNPGGWAPASALRAVYKREYPKFLKRFTGYVIDQCKNKPITF